MLLRLPFDIQYYIFDFFAIDDLFNFEIVSKQIRQLCLNINKKKLFTKKIIMALNKIGLDEKFIDVLINDGAMISGSFVLQTLLGKEWDGDIDIYTVSKPYNFESL